MPWRDASKNPACTNARGQKPFGARRECSPRAGPAAACLCAAWGGCRKPAEPLRAEPGQWAHASQAPRPQGQLAPAPTAAFSRAEALGWPRAGRARIQDVIQGVLI